MKEGRNYTIQKWMVNIGLKRIKIFSNTQQKKKNRILKGRLIDTDIYIYIYIYMREREGDNHNYTAIDK